MDKPRILLVTGFGDGIWIWNPVLCLRWRGRKCVPRETKGVYAEISGCVWSRVLPLGADGLASSSQQGLGSEGTIVPTCSCSNTNNVPSPLDLNAGILMKRVEGANALRLCGWCWGGVAACLFGPRCQKFVVAAPSQSTTRHVAG